MTASELVAELRTHANPANVAGMARYGINTEGTLGVPIPVIRALARKAGRNHALALELWESGVHEARILATLVADPGLLTRREADRWARDFNSWDVCDQACQNLLRYTPYAFEKAARWARARSEFVRRAGFSLMAGLASKAKSAPDEQFEAFLPLIAEAATDDRNMVRKAVNWALRGIGKRNRRLMEKATAAAEQIRGIESRSARWIAADALRELRQKSAAMR
jgi:3-methyladenine DNA glycosylase AlkD